MTTTQLYKTFQNRQGRNAWLATALLLLMGITLGIDFLFAQFQNSGFYLSESLLFSAYWLLFLPLLNVQWKLAKQTSKIGYQVALTLLAIAAHLFLYPALVWFLSGCFFDHTFAYRQTFDYGLTAYFIKTMLIYGLSALIIAKPKNNASGYPVIAAKQDGVEDFLTSLLVSDKNNTKTAIATHSILYFSASPPYVALHQPSKKYLYSGTLKGLEARLDSRLFLRIHKSYIVNMASVVSYQSRLNGDFDLTLTDDTVLRVSRHYAAAFKTCFEERHPLTAK